MIATLAMSSIAEAATIEVLKGDTPSKLVCPAKISKVFNKLPEINTDTDKPLSPEQIKQRIANVSRKYGLDYDQLHSVLQCESNLRANRYGDGGKAFGIAQFHKVTFDHFCKGDYYNSNDQLECMAKMFQDGRAKHWTCFRKLNAEVIYTTPFSHLVVNK